MRYFTPTKTWCFFYGYIGTIFLHFANQPAKCHDDAVFDNWGNFKGYQAVCDPEYRSKYFNDRKHKEAIKAAVLFVPPPDIPKNDYDRIIGKYNAALFKRMEENKQRPQQPSHWDLRQFKQIGRNFTNDNYHFDNILQARSYSNASKEEQLAEMRRRIILKNKCYKIKYRYHKSGRRKMRRNGKKFKRRHSRRRSHKKRHSSRRWGIWDYDDSDSDRYLCKSWRRIVGGMDAVSAEVLPYMAFVDTGCGGGIISDKFVLTAGHCVDEGDEPKYVHVGSIKLMSGCQYPIVHVWIHPQYSRKNIQNDISLLKINPPFVWSPAIQPIKLSFTKAVEKTCGIVAGWGAGAYKGLMKLNLAMVSIPVVSRRKCHKYGIRKSQFCGGYDDGSMDTCQGDSGGPFVVDDRLVGIVSYGFKCARPHNPGVYEDVSYHRLWIRSITGI